MTGESGEAIYRERLSARSDARDRLLRDERRLSNLRLLLAAVIAVVAWLAFVSGVVPGWVVVIPILAFIAVAIVHHEKEKARIAASRAVGYYRSRVERLGDGWAGRFDSGLEFLDREHPYAIDLDLFGAGSLFERLSSAVTPAGRRTLAGWLLEPASASEIEQRQGAVGELTSRIDLRETIHVTATEGGKRDDDRLLRWANEAGRDVSGDIVIARIVAVVSSVIFLASMPALFAELVGRTHPAYAFDVATFSRVALLALPFVLIAEWIFASRRAAATERVIAAIEPAVGSLESLMHAARVIERTSFEHPKLVSLRNELVEGETASAAVDRLRRLAILIDSRRNPFFAPFAGLMLWSTILALSAERWRYRHGPRIGRWVAAVGEIEALLSFAAWKHEEPETVFPELTEEAPTFVATDLGHPVIPLTRLVRNDVAINPRQRLLIVSGSNMSGKSTLLRTIGSAVVLGLAGGPVRASSLRLSPLRLASSITVNDSLQEGKSRFYAEILRLRMVVERATGEPPLLFLLDEILHGTNSHDRRIGAVAVVRTLVAAGAAGLVTTHDLAITDLAGQLGDVARNVHFEDRVEGDAWIFDYRMKPGVVARSNAIALMRSVGLEVGDG